MLEQDKEYFAGKMELNMKEDSWIIYFVDMVKSNIQMVENTKATFWMVKCMGKENFRYLIKLSQWPDGRIYEGQYENDKKHGNGILTG